MRLYYLRTSVKSVANAAIYPNGKIYDAVYDFAVAGTLEKKSLPKKLVAKCQDGISASDLKNLDYLHSYGGIPIFSNKLLDSLKDLASEICLTKTTIIADGVGAEFNIAKILKREQLVNYQKSGIGTANFMAGTYFNRKPEINFLIARDGNPLCQSVFAVSDKFKKLALENNLNVIFKEVAYA